MNTHAQNPFSDADDVNGISTCKIAQNVEMDAKSFEVRRDKSMQTDTDHGSWLQDDGLRWYMIAFDTTYPCGSL